MQDDGKAQSRPKRGSCEGKRKVGPGVQDKGVATTVEDGVDGESKIEGRATVGEWVAVSIDDG